MAPKRRNLPFPSGSITKFAATYVEAAFDLNRTLDLMVEGEGEVRSKQSWRNWWNRNEKGLKQEIDSIKGAGRQGAGYEARVKDPAAVSIAWDAENQRTDESSSEQGAEEHEYDGTASSAYVFSPGIDARCAHSVPSRNASRRSYSPEAVVHKPKLELEPECRLKKGGRTIGFSVTSQAPAVIATLQGQIRHESHSSASKDGMDPLSSPAKYHRRTMPRFAPNQTSSSAPRCSSGEEPHTQDDIEEDKDLQTSERTVRLVGQDGDGYIADEESEEEADFRSDREEEAESESGQQQVVQHAVSVFSEVSVAKNANQKPPTKQYNPSVPARAPVGCELRNISSVNSSKHGLSESNEENVAGVKRARRVEKAPELNPSRLTEDRTVRKAAPRHIDFSDFDESDTSLVSLDDQDSRASMILFCASFRSATETSPQVHPRTLQDVIKIYIQSSGDATVMLAYNKRKRTQAENKLVRYGFWSRAEDTAVREKYEKKTEGQGWKDLLAKKGEVALAYKRYKWLTQWHAGMD